ncbi:MAG: M16 family metallopeptidase, partial [Desulfobacteraceae bacterium]
RGARMTQEITRKGLAVNAWAANPDNRYGGMLILGGVPNQPAEEDDSAPDYLEACRELEELLAAEAERLKQEPVPESELSRIRNLNRYDFLKRLRSNEDLAQTLATLEVQVGWDYMEDYLERISEVTAEDVMRAAKKYIREDRRTTCFVIPGEGGGESSAEGYEEARSPGAASAPAVPGPEDMTNHSDYPTPEGWRHPLSFERTPEKIEYPEARRASVEGASLFYLPDRELPLVELKILAKAGAVDVPKGRIGLAELLEACLVRGGTKEYSPGELAVALDEHAIDIDVSVGEEETLLKVSCMRSEWEKALGLLEEILVHPRFDREVVEAERDKIMTRLARQAGDAAAVSRREMEVWHFQGHPYGRDPLAALETLPSVTVRDLVGFVERYLVPANMKAALSGDLDFEEAEAGIKDLMRSLQGDEAPERDLDEPRSTPPVLAFIHKPGQVQSQVSMCLPGLLRTDPDYWKVNLLTDVFGGRASLLNQRLREELGLVYATYFYQSFKWRAGWLVGYIGCKGDRTPEALLETVRLMKRVQEELPADELERKRLDALNSFVFNVDTPSSLTEAYARYELRGEPLDTLGRIQESFMEARLEELQDLAAEYLDPGGLQIFVVGDGTVPVETEDGRRVPLEKALGETADEIGLPFEVLPLR